MTDTSPGRPWISMWLHPRQTIRQIIDTDPDRSVWRLAAVIGIGNALDRAAEKSSGDHGSLGEILLPALIFGPISGIIGLYIFGALLRWTGPWIGGHAVSRDIRAALAWASVLSIWAIILWVPQLLFFGKEVFTSETPVMDASPALTALFRGISVVEFVVGVWAFVVFLKCLGEVQGFSAWRALGNILLVPLVILVTVFVVVGAFTFLKWVFVFLSG